MLFRFLFFSSVLFGMFGTSAFADGKNAAAKLCQQMGFSSDILKCVEKTSQAQYFSQAALKVCGAMSFASEKLKCLELIKDQKIGKASATTCGGMSFSNQKLRCLAAASTPWQPPSPPKTVVEEKTPPQVKRQIRKALRQLDRGRPHAARSTLRSLLDRIRAE